MFKWIQSANIPSSSKAGPSSNTAPASASTSNNNAGPSTASATAASDALACGEGPDAKRFGMENFGNTCYANSVLQALYFCQPFRDLVIANASQDPIPSIPPPPLPQVAPPQTPIPLPTVTTHPTKRTPSKSGHKRTGSISEDTPANKPPEEPPAQAPAPIPPNPATLYLALRGLFAHIAQHPAGKGVVAPQAFVGKLKKENALFRSSMHQDAHEFLNYLLNKIVEDLEEETKADVLSKSISSMNTSTSVSSGGPSAASLSASPSPVPTPLVQSLFQGTLTNETRCLTCERVTSRSEPFLDLSLDISQNTSLNACLRHFSKSEMLTARNKFFCDECCGLVEAEKRMKIKTLPPILLLHLKRFKYQEDLQRYVKLSYRVAFPLELRLYNNTVDPTSADLGAEARGRRKDDFGLGPGDEGKGAGSGGPGDPEGLYKLFAVVVHIGGGPHHGHYITLVKSPNTWLLFDDDSVEPIKESEISKYFGDSTFTVEAAINAANAPVAPATPAALPPPAITMFGGIGGGPLTTSAKVLAANPAPSAQAKTGTPVQGGTAPGQPAGTTATTTTISGTGSGYVLFYQAANIDLRGLGLIAAAAEAKVAGIAKLEAEAAKVVVEVQPAQIYVEEPEDESTKVNGHGPHSQVGTSSPSFSSSSSSSAARPQPPSPTLAPSTSLGPTTSSSGSTTTSTSGKVGLALDLPGPANGHLAEDQLSPLVLPPPAHANGGFFKSLKHSASVGVGKGSGGGLGGFGLGMSSPTPIPPRAVSSTAGSSTPVLPVASKPNGDVVSFLAPPPPPPPKEKSDKEKEKLSGWFSTARKSVKRRSRNKSKEREKEAVGTASFSSAVSDKAPTKREPKRDSATDSRPQSMLDANGYGGWVGGGLLSNNWVGLDGGTNGPAYAVGALAPASATKGVNGQEERRASEPTAGSDIPPVPVQPRSSSLVENGNPVVPSNGTKLSPPQEEHLEDGLNGLVPPRPTTPRTPTTPTAFTTSDSATIPSLQIPGARSPGPTSTSPFSVGSAPSSPSISSPMRNGRFVPPPRKSLTLFDQGTPAPILHFKDDGVATTGGGLMKRASRKMSLNSSSIRLSGFGWNTKDKDKDR